MMAYNFWKNDASPVLPRSTVGGWRACWLLAAIVTVVGIWSLHHRSAVWPADAEKAGPPAPMLESRINPNEADWPSLCRLPGIGPARAQAIVAYRERYRQTHGPAANPFARPEDLTVVEGIGPKTIADFKSFLVFN